MNFILPFSWECHQLTNSYFSEGQAYHQPDTQRARDEERSLSDNQTHLAGKSLINEGFEGFSCNGNNGTHLSMVDFPASNV